MRRSLLALLVMGALAGFTPQAHADDPTAYCEGVAAQQALPILNQSYQFSPNGYGPAGYGPMIGPFGAGPMGPAALYGPLGPLAVPYGPAGSLTPGGPLPIVAAGGPLGPGLTSTILRPIVLPPPAPAAAGAAPAANLLPVSQIGLSGPIGLAGRPQLSLASVVTPPPNNLGTQIQLGMLQQAELTNMLARYTNSANYQLASSFWASAYAAQAQETYSEVLSNCKDALIGPGGPLGALGGALGTAGGPAGAAAAGTMAPPGGSPPAPNPSAPSTAP